MKNFLEQAFLLAPIDPDTKRAFDLVARGRSLLQRSQSKAQLNIRNVESVFAAFEMASLFGRLGDMPPEEVKELGSAMRRLIVHTIEHYMVVPVYPKRMGAPRNYGEFGKLVRELGANGHQVSVLTFNYDIGIDLGLWQSGIEVDYCLRPEPIDEQGRTIDLIKLHGSLNWVGCSKCGQLIPRQMRYVQESALKANSFMENPLPFLVELRPLSTLGQLRESRCSCGAEIGAEPVIIPPTPNKARLHEELRTVWARAAHHLREADNIFVIGYSWPDGDHFFHQLYAVGTVGDVVLRRFWVCDPDPAVREKFQRLLLGQQALDCFGPEAALEAYRFGGAIDAIAGMFGVTIQ